MLSQLVQATPLVTNDVVVPVEPGSIGAMTPLDTPRLLHEATELVEVATGDAKTVVVPVEAASTAATSQAAQCAQAISVSGAAEAKAASASRAVSSLESLAHQYRSRIVDGGGIASAADEARSTLTLDEAKSQLEDLQVYSISRLIEDVKLPDRTAKLLYITNRQAAKFHIGNLRSFTEAMGIKQKPKFVINMMFESIAIYPCGARTEINWRDWPGHGDHSHRPALLSAELGEDGLMQTERRITAMLRDCVLPIAEKTNALVLLGSTRCAMSRIFGEMCAEEALKYNGRLPFTVMHIGSAVDYWVASTTNGSTLYHLRHGSPRWMASSRLIEEARCQGCSPWRSGFEHTIAPEGCTHYIITEDCNPKEKRIESAAVLESMFMSQLSCELPSIGICTLGTPWFPMKAGWGIDGISGIANYLGKGLHLLLLDSRAEPSSEGVMDIEMAVSSLLDFEKELEKEGKVNSHYTSTIARLRSALRNEIENIMGDQEVLNNEWAFLMDSNEGRTRGTGKLLWEMREEAVRLRELDQGDKYQNTSVMVDKHAVLDRIVDSFMRIHDATREGFIETVEPALRGREIDSWLTKMDGCATAREVGDLLWEMSMTWMGICRWHINAAKNMMEACPDHIEVEARGEWGPVMVLSEIGKGEFALVKDRLREVFEALRSRRCECGHYDYAYGMYTNEVSSQLYDATKQVFASPCLHTCNLRSLKTITCMINMIARIDKLPIANSPEGNAILLRLWEKVDIYTAVAARCKMYAKISYVLLLLVGMMVTVLTTISINQPHVLSGEVLNAAVMGLTLFGSALAAAIAFINPMTKWQQLRSASQAIEAEIWQYRTRSGAYSIDSTISPAIAARRPDERLLQVSEGLINHVLKSASVVDTAFFSRFDGLFREPKNKRVYRHGQHKGCRSDGTQGNCQGDDHHSPITPKQYISLRVQSQVIFYQARLPGYDRARVAVEGSTVLASLSGAVLAFLDLSSWATLSAAVTTAVIAYGKFLSPETKLSRFSDCVAGIDATLLWWDSLTDPERASQGSIDGLVQRCEGLFYSERQGWVSTVLQNDSLKSLVEKAGQRGGKGRQHSSRVTPLDEDGADFE